jgi:hypothetical protein
MVACAVKGLSRIGCPKGWDDVAFEKTTFTCQNNQSLHQEK